MFMITMKDKLKGADVKNNEYAKIAGEMWRNLPDEEKEQWR